MITVVGSALCAVALLIGAISCGKEALGAGCRWRSFMISGLCLAGTVFFILIAVLAYQQPER
jgi:hypothetical protein